MAIDYTSPKTWYEILNLATSEEKAKLLADKSKLPPLISQMLQDDGSVVWPYGGPAPDINWQQSVQSVNNSPRKSPIANTAKSANTVAKQLLTPNVPLGNFAEVKEAAIGQAAANASKLPADDLELVPDEDLELVPDEPPRTYAKQNLINDRPWNMADEVNQGFATAGLLGQMENPLIKAEALGSAWNNFTQNVGQGMPIGDAFTSNFNSQQGAPSTYARARDQLIDARNNFLQQNPITGALAGGVGAALPTVVTGNALTAGAKEALTAAGKTSLAKFLAGEGGTEAGKIAGTGSGYLKNLLTNIGSRAATGGLEGAYGAYVSAPLSNMPLTDQLALGGGIGSGVNLLAGATGTALKLGNKLARPFLNNGAEALADDAVAPLLKQQNAIEPPLPNMVLSAGQQTGDPTLLRLEEKIAQVNPDFSQALNAQNAANKGIIASQAQALIPEQSGREAGAQMREALKSAEGEALTTKIAKDLRESLGVDGNYYTALDNLSAAQKANSAPLWAEALDGGSTAPLKTQLEQGYVELVGQGDAALAKVAQLETELAKTKQFNAKLASGPTAQDNFAKGPSSMQDNTFIPRPVANIQAELTQAKDEVKSISNATDAQWQMLKRATEDETLNVPGAVWSPRISAIVNNAEARRGLLQGFQIAKNYADASGMPLNATEFAMQVGKDGQIVMENGLPKVVEVPTMAILDNVRKSFDEVINAARNPNTGKVEWTNHLRSVEALRQGLIREMDRLRPVYGEARAVYAGPAAVKNAMAMGRDIFNKDPEQSAKVLDSLGTYGDAELEGFRAGAVRAFEDMLNSTSAKSAARLVRDTLDTPQTLAQLRIAFPTEESFQGFVSRAAVAATQPKEVETALAQLGPGLFALPEEQVVKQFIKPQAPTALENYINFLGKGAPEVQEAGLEAARRGFGAIMRDTLTTARGPEDLANFAKNFQHVINNDKMFNSAQRELFGKILAAAEIQLRNAGGSLTEGGKQVMLYYTNPMLEALIGPRTTRAVMAAGAYKLGSVFGDAAAVMASGAGAGYGGKASQLLFGQTQQQVQQNITNRLLNPMAYQGPLSVSQNVNKLMGGNVPNVITQIGSGALRIGKNNENIEPVPGVR